MAHDKDDITTWSASTLAFSIDALRMVASHETDEVLAQHYKIQIAEQRDELAKRNAAAIAALAAREVS